MRVESEAYWSTYAQEIQPRILLMTRIGWHREGAGLVAAELQARQIAMEAHRKLTPKSVKSVVVSVISLFIVCYRSEQVRW